MENENKSVKEPAKNKNHRHKPHGKGNHSRGYFITPPEEGAQKPQGGAAQQNTAKQEQKPKNDQKPQNNQKPKAEQKPQGASPTPQSESGERKNGNGNRNNRKRRRGHGSHHGQKPTDNHATSTERTADIPKENKKPTQPSETQNRQAASRHSHNRPKNHANLQLRETLDEPKPILVEEDVVEETVDVASISPDVLETPGSMPATDDDDTVARVEVVGIRFKSTGKIYYFDPAGKTYSRGHYAIVETARGLEYGEIALANTKVKETDVVPPLRPILREATKNDCDRHEENKKKEAEAFKICNQKIADHKLDMKLIEAQYTFDNSKLLFYFTSAGRVDFRELVKDLASVFRTRIELRQIGIRDEAKMMGGLGMCGRPLCCSVFLSDFCQVSIKMAKEQNFSLNSSKISGICGRLMCCLRFEYETYEYEIKRTPPVDSVVQTPDGNGVVIENSPLAGTVKVRLSVTPEVAPKVYKREDVVVLQKKQSNPKNNEKQK